QKTKDQGFFRWLDRWYSGWVVWALDHPKTIITTSLAVFLLTFPLNRMIGRTFVPDEDMGELTIHLDMPEGTSLQGSEQIAKNLVRELQGVEGIADLQPMTGGRVTHIHLQGIATPFEKRRVTQEQIVAELHKRLAAHQSLKPSITVRE